MSLFDEDDTDDLEVFIEETASTPDPIDVWVAEAKADPKGWVATVLADPDKLFHLAQLRVDDYTAFKLLDVRLKDEAKIANRQSLLSAVRNFADMMLVEQKTFTPEAKVETPTVTEPPTLASEPDLLERAARAIHARGVSGEDASVKLLYLCVTTRLLDRIVSAAVKGPSSAGKSWLVDKVLELFPPEAFYKLTAFSEHALAYSEEPVEHRMMVLYEAESMNNDFSAYLLRSLLSEGCIDYETVEKTIKGLKARRIHRPGPTGLIVTTTKIDVHAENETRLMSVSTNDSRNQTRRIMLETARQRSNGLVPAAVDEWWKLQRWLAGGDTKVAVPFAIALAQNIPPLAVRLRRDFNAIFSLIQAHALLHRASREVDVDGHIVATFADYEAVRALVEPVLAEALGVGVDDTTRATVDAVQELFPKHPAGVPSKAVAEHLNIDRQAAVRRLRRAAAREFVTNIETRQHQLARWEPNADLLPDDVAVLPTVETLRSVIT